jgi:hypothetical protein
MTATFKVSFGEIKCKTGSKGKLIDKKCMSTFWDSVGSGDSRGVYVFGVRAPRGFKPLYVGRTKKQNFRTRIGQHVQSSVGFNKMLVGVRKGVPVLFIIARVGKGRSSNSAIDELESDFINYAFARNKYLHNDRGIKKPKYLIKGFGIRGKPPKEVVGLKQMVGYT